MDKDYLRSVCRWTAIIHIVGFSILAFSLVLFWFFGFFEDNFSIIVGFLAPFIIMVNVFWFFISPKILKSSFWFYFFLFINLVVTTAIVHFSGGQDSPFPFLYLITVVPVSFISLRLFIGIGGFTIFLFLALIYLEPPAGIQFLVFIRLMRLLLLGAIVAFQAYFFISRIRKRDEERIKMHDNFLFRTVHELRSPTVGIKWAIAKFSDPEYLKRNPDAYEFLSDLSKMNERKIKLLQDLVVVAKGEESKIEFQKESFNLVTAIKEILKEFEFLAKKKKIEINYSPENEFLVLCDKNRVYEIFTNLIDNAIKYNRENGTIAISHKKEGDFVRTVVEDTGIGITKEDLSKIFTPYFRALSNQKISGTGLGLYIVKNLVERMGGKIEISSDFGRGTKIAVFLPSA